MDLDAVLLTVQERDKWRKRLAGLERALGDVKLKQRRAKLKLRRIRQELSRLRDLSEVVAMVPRVGWPVGGSHAAHDARLPAR